MEGKNQSPDPSHAQVTVYGSTERRHCPDRAPLLFLLLLALTSVCCFLTLLNSSIQHLVTEHTVILTAFTAKPLYNLEQ